MGGVHLGFRTLWFPVLAILYLLLHLLLVFLIIHYFLHESRADLTSIFIIIGILWIYLRMNRDDAFSIDCSNIELINLFFNDLLLLTFIKILIINALQIRLPLSERSFRCIRENINQFYKHFFRSKLLKLIVCETKVKFKLFMLFSEVFGVEFAGIINLTIDIWWWIKFFYWTFFQIFWNILNRLL